MFLALANSCLKKKKHSFSNTMLAPAVMQRLHDNRCNVTQYLHPLCDLNKGCMQGSLFVRAE